VWGHNFFTLKKGRGYGPSLSSLGLDEKKRGKEKKRGNREQFNLFGFGGGGGEDLWIRDSISFGGVVKGKGEEKEKKVNRILT